LHATYYEVIIIYMQFYLFCTGSVLLHTLMTTVHHSVTKLRNILLENTEITYKSFSHHLWNNRLLARFINKVHKEI